jgi:hypothetical protein
MNFVSCTIHLAKDTEDKPYGHYFALQQFNFTDCHFEILHHDVNAVYKNCFYASQAIVNFTDCEFICTDSELIIDEAFFNAPWSVGAPSQINVTGANAKYMFGRIHPNSATTTLCKGNVFIDKTAWGFSYDSTSIIKMPIYEVWPFTDENGYEKIGGLASATISAVKNADNSVSVSVTGSNTSWAYKMLGKRIYVGSHKAVSVYCKIVLHTLTVQAQFAADNDTAGSYGLIFYGNGQKIPFRGITNIYIQKTASADGDEFSYRLTLPIPNGVDYIVYGPAFNTKLAAFNFDVVECYAELL